MVTTAFQQPGQASTPGAPVYPAAPQTGTYQGEEYPIYEVPINGTTERLMLVTKGREQSTFVDPNDPAATPIVWDGHWRTLTQAWTFAPGVRQLHDRLVAARLPAAPVQHGRDRGPEHDRCGLVGDRRRLRLRPVPVPVQERPVHRPDRHDHPADPGDAPAALRHLHQDRLERDVAAADRAARSSPTPTTSSCSASTSCRSRATSTRPR